MIFTVYVLLLLIICAAFTAFSCRQKLISMVWVGAFGASMCWLFLCGLFLVGITPDHNESIVLWIAHGLELAVILLLVKTFVIDSYPKV